MAMGPTDHRSQWIKYAPFWVSGKYALLGALPSEQISSRYIEHAATGRGYTASTFEALASSSSR